jgi:hypothetical protein
VQTAFALRYIDVKPGEGPEVQPGQFYTVHYTGWRQTAPSLTHPWTAMSPSPFPKVHTA